LPLGYVLGIHNKMGLIGLWWGMVSGIFILALYYFYLVTIRFNWEEISEQALIRAEKELQRDSKIEDDDTIETSPNKMKQQLL
jgi:hypothetical protein